MRRMILTGIGTAVLAAAGLVWLVGQCAAVAASGAVAPTPPPTAVMSPEVAALKAHIERLKGMVPDQSHAMKDVPYHFANL